VNLSAQQFRRADFCPRIAEILGETGIDPGQVEMELTESMLMDDAEDAIGKMHQLRSLGISLSIDDFGTGYSSLNYLMRFPLHTLKIDKSFVHALLDDGGNAAITKAIIAMAKSLNLSVVAEGVESRQQFDWLQENDCDIVQGYFFSPPLTSDSFGRFMSEASGKAASVSA